MSYGPSGFDPPFVFNDPNQLYIVGGKSLKMNGGGSGFWNVINKKSNVSQSAVFTGVAIEPEECVSGQPREFTIRFIVNGMYRNQSGPSRFFINFNENKLVPEYTLEGCFCDVYDFKRNYFITHLKEYNEDEWFDKWKNEAYLPFMSLESTINELKRP